MSELDRFVERMEDRLADIRADADRLRDELAAIARLQEVLRESEARFRTITDSANDAIISADEAGDILTWNGGAARIFGWSAEEAVGKPLTIIIPKSFHEAHNRGIARVNAGGERRAIGKTVELAGLHRDGSEFPIELSLATWESGSARYYCGIIRDITARKQAENALRESEAQLREQAHKLEEVSQAKSRFLASMSHELRTPLNAILGYSELLQDECNDRGLSDLIPDLTKIHTSGAHLLQLINGILDLSKIEAGKMELFIEEFDLLPFLNDVAGTVKPLVEKNGNRLVLELGGNLGNIAGDITKIRQMLFNLINNSSKFTERGEVRLRASRVATPQGGEIVCQVCDTGIGMTADQIAHLFQPFTQGDASTSRKYGGTGLGLVLTKQFCEMMGGRVEVASTVGVGSTFTVHLPVVAGMPKRNAAAAPGPQTAGRTVLVIDDDPSVIDLIRRHLTSDGYQVIGATSGDEGVALARKQPPDIITVDILMPTKDGWTVIRQLKDTPETANIPIIVISVAENRDLAFSLGVTDYLNKPLSKDRLVDTLRKYRISRVLIIDDDPASRELLRDILVREGWAVREAVNGVEGLAAVAAEPPELILLDLMMPGMDGFQFVHALRSEPAYRHIPVVVLSALDLTANDHQRLRGHVESIFQKGAVSPEQLVREIRERLPAPAAGTP